MEQSMSVEARPAQRPGALTRVVPLRYRQRVPGRWLREHGATLFGAIVLLAAGVAAVFAPWLAPHDPFEQHVADALAGPSSRHPLGTDDLGRDVLRPLMYGARGSLGGGFAWVLGGLLAGAALGLASGYYGGWVDSLVMRCMDVLFAFPPILLAIAIMAVLGSDLQNV